MYCKDRIEVKIGYLLDRNKQRYGKTERIKNVCEDKHAIVCLLPQIQTTNSPVVVRSFFGFSCDVSFLWLC